MHSEFPPTPSDYFGVLWALAGVQDALVLEHGALGTALYNVNSFNAMNRCSPKGIIFTTGVEEHDVVMGCEEKLIRAAVELDKIYSPKIISLVASPITGIIGLDLEGVTEELRSKCNARLLSFQGGGWRGRYSDGIKEVFQILVDKIATEPLSRDPRAVNIIGPTMDVFNHHSDFCELKRLLALLKVRVNSVLTHQTSFEQIQTLSSASLNIITRNIGFDAAMRLQDRFGMPYHYGFPIGLRGTVQWLKSVSDKLGIRLEKKILANELKVYGSTMDELLPWGSMKPLKVALSCSYDYAINLSRFIQEEWNFEIMLVVLPFPPESEDDLSEFSSMNISNVLIAPSAEEFESALNEVQPHIFFGNSYELRLASNIPIKLYAGIPAFDYINIYDGTPFLGFKGSLYLTQTIVNSIVERREELDL